MKDYPFKTFSDFIDGLHRIHTDEVDEIYPKLHEAIENDEYEDVVLKNLKKLIPNEDDEDDEEFDNSTRSQDALNEIVKCYINAKSSEVLECMWDGCCLIDYLLEVGATFPTEILFNGINSSYYNCSFDDQLSGNYLIIVARLLDLYGENHNIDISPYADWVTIKALNYEDYTSDELDALNNEPDSKKQEIRMGQLKYLSEYIQAQ